MKGKIYLVGAGPSDPELITRKGAALLRKAGCVIYDRLVNRDLLKLARSRCEKIYAGKSADEKGRGQRRINRLLVQQAAKHAVVVRLKGGDPALFGRMSEEIETLEKAGVPYEVVPGVSSVWAAASALGIPLTDRRLSSSVAFVTGHRAAGRYPSVRWKELSRGADTLVVLMGRATLSEIVRRLRAAGRPASTPVALVRWASDPRQELLVSTIGEVEAELARRPGFGPPVVLIIGEVVRLARGGKKPLAGRSVLVTRPVSDSEGLAGLLKEKGAVCRALPTIAVRPARIGAARAKALLKELPGQDWVLFNSHHGVEALQRLAGRAGKRLGALVRARVCAIGPRTEAAAREAGLKVSLRPTDFSLEGVRAAFARVPLKGKKVFIPRSNLAIGDPLAKSLRARGARVTEAALYDTVPVRVPAGKLRRALKYLDAATFTSASTARNFLSAVRAAGIPVRAALNGTAVVAIGPATARELKKGGVRQVHLPKNGWTVEGLADAVAEALKR
ncbi:MAG: uroporphyrinogen-III C-methyltransferase [Candidatus Omnitrophota bacterium]|nr:uroporphyrinogen-III C-methyltransferase [Candidatus Omnitrophota bacterium]